MFFKRTNCPNCNSRFDELADFCPFCGFRNEEHAEFKKKYPMTYVPWYKELILALTGLFGFTVISLLVGLILQFSMGPQYQENPSLSSMLINTLSYLAFFLIVFILLFPYFRDIANKFKIGWAYLFAGIGFTVLVTVSIVYGNFIQIVRPGTGEGGNQSAVVNMVLNYPWISILILGLIGPICEEVAYRIGLFTLLRRIHPVVAYIGTAFIFGIIHFDFTNTDLITELIYLPEYMFAGLCFSFIYERKGIAASTLAHISNNLLSVVIILLASQV